MHYYFVGIKGAGMSALAQLLHARGHGVEGSDVAQHFFTDALLARRGISVHQGFNAAHLHEGVERLVYSTAYQPTSHVELVEAKRRGIPCESYPEAVGRIMREFRVVAIAGTHGKTTTAALVAYIFQQAGYDPSAIIGGDVPVFRGNVRVGRSRWLVFEADEYQNKFLYYAPNDLLLLNIDYDHPDFFETPASYTEAFRDFVHRCSPQGVLVVNADDPALRAIASAVRKPATLFGESEHADIRLQPDYRADGWHHVVISHAGKQHDIATGLPGRHNATNILAAASLCRALGISWEIIQKSCATFSGVRRRFEMKGEYRGAMIIDDYAHHPTAISAVIQTAREYYPLKRVIAVFQPHTFSRTRVLLKEFARSLSADMVVLLEVYASAREQNQGAVSSSDLLKILPAASHGRFASDITDAADILKKEAGPQDVVLLLGAGDTGHIADLLFNPTNHEPPVP